MKTSTIITLSIEKTDGSTFDYGFHLGSDVALAKKRAVELMETHPSEYRSVALMDGTKMIDCLEYRGWQSESREEENEAREQADYDAETKAVAGHETSPEGWDVNPLYQATSDVIRLERENSELLARIAAMTLTPTGEERLSALEVENAALRAELDAQPARWSQDSSLETWFPMTAQDQTAHRSLLDLAEGLICNAVPMAHCTQDEWDTAVKNWRDEKHGVSTQG